jgi:hypothetical protein
MNFKKYFRILCLGAFLVSAHSFLSLAQSCPIGTYPVGGGSAGWEGCVPYNDSEPVQPSGPEWRKQWIAIAMGEGSYGVSVDQSSKRKAEKEALAKCRKSGKGKCSLAGVTYNQCVATANGGGFGMNYAAPTIKQAEEGALRDCREKIENASCSIYFSHCSYSVRLR